MKIKSLSALRVWDSRGRPTIEVCITTQSGITGRAIAPAGASTGSGEAVDRRDGGSFLGGYDVLDAVHAARTEMADALIGHDVRDQEAIDRALEQCDGTPNFARLGGNAAIATSMAAAHAAAAHQPLWWHLLDETQADVMLPVPEIQIFGGGAHAAGQMDLQDFMVVPFGAESFAQAMEWTAHIYHTAGAFLDEKSLRFGVADEGGYWPVFDSNEEAIEALLSVIERAGFCPKTQVGMSIDVAASQFFENGIYNLARDNSQLAPDEWYGMVSGWLDRYPIKMIEDPFDETDLERHRRFTQENGHRAQVVGDDLLVTHVDRVERAAALGACNTLLCKPNQAGTVSRAKQAADAAREAGWDVVVSARSGESEDVSIVHFVIGWQMRQLKVGSFSRSERMAKWNEVLRIEQSLGSRAHYAGGDVFGKFVRT